MKECAIVNFAEGKWYAKGQSRLLQSIRGIDWLDWRMFNRYKDILDCPLHHEAPYAFKPHALLRAIELGYRYVLWLDASAWCIKNPIETFAEIKKTGYVLQNSGYFVGDWSTDAFLNKYGLPRAKAKTIPMIQGMIVGIDANNDRAYEFLLRWYDASRDGVSFVGGWDEHRHDMTAGGAIVAEMSLPLQPLFSFATLVGWYKQYEGKDECPKTIEFLAEGM